MSRVYLVRHGQAGTRKAYDSLSELGRQQARLLGKYFVSEGIQFTAAYSGELVRQQQTACEVKTAFAEARVEFPDIVPDPGWNEFNLDHIYRAFAPQMCEEDAAFAAEYEEMVAQARASAHQHDAHVNRRWLPCDAKIVMAWIGEKYSYDGESWRAFQQRVRDRRRQLEDPDGNIVVFTSATPIAIWTAFAMEIDDERAMRLAGVLQNTSCTVLRLTEQLRLHSFNGVPHLQTPELRTYR